MEGQCGVWISLREQLAQQITPYITMYGLHNSILQMNIRHLLFQHTIEFLCVFSEIYRDSCFQFIYNNVFQYVLSVFGFGCLDAVLLSSQRPCRVLLIYLFLRLALLKRKRKIISIQADK